MAHLPDAEESDEEVCWESRGEHLRDQEHVAGQSALEHDWHVGRVEQLDGVGASLTSHLARLDWDLDPEALEVDDQGEDEHCGEEVHNVGQSLSVKRLLERSGLVVPGEEEVEEGNDSALKLWASTGVDSVGGEGLPDDVLANVGSDEQGNTRSQAVALGEELVEEDDDERGGDELEDEQEADTGTERGGRAVETGEDVDRGLAEGDDQREDYKR